MRIHVRSLTLTFGATVLLLLLGCSGFFEKPPVATIRYELVAATDGLASPDVWHEVGANLSNRFTDLGFADAQVEAEMGRIDVTIERIEGRDDPIRLFEVGALQVHRVDELETKGADRNMRQVLVDAGIDRTHPPEAIWDVLRAKTALTEDRQAYFSETFDGRETMVVIQAVPFLRRELFDGARWTDEAVQCAVVGDWTDRLEIVISNDRVLRQKERVAILLDGDLLEVRTPRSLLDGENALLLTPPPEQSGEGGRRIWESRGDPTRWCRELAAVLAHGPLAFPLELKEIHLNQPLE